MKKGKNYRVTLATFPTIIVDPSWDNIRGEQGTYGVKITDLQNGVAPYADVYAIQDNPFGVGDYDPSQDVKLVLKNVDPNQPGESILITEIKEL